MLHIADATIQALKQEKISELTVRIISGGCAGNKIEVAPLSPEKIEEYTNLGAADFPLWVENNQASKLDGGVLTKTPKSWILTHPDIQSRCGCSTSFSFEKKEKIPSLHVLKDLKKQFQKPTD